MVVQYVSFDRASDRLVLCEQPENMVVDGVIDYVRHYNRIDPHVQHLKQMPLGTVIDTESLFPARTMKTHPFYSEFWATYGVRGMLAGKIDEGEQHYSYVGILRHNDSPRFTIAERELAERCVHHLSTALRIARHVRQLQLTSNVGLHVMAHAGRPMILLGPGRRVLFSNPEGRDYLAGETILSVRDGRLQARGAALSDKLQAAIAALERRPDASLDRGDAASRIALRLERPGVPVALCTLWQLDPERMAGAYGDQGVVLLSIAHPGFGQPPDVHFVAAMLDLTPAEARIASLLAVGEEVGAIAAMNGVSINTVRTQVRSIYFKTNTRRQVELIRLINTACAP